MTIEDNDPEDFSKLEKELEEIEQTTDLRKLLRLCKATREEFSTETLTFPDEEIYSLVESLKKDETVYKQVGDKLDDWENLKDSARSQVLGQVYDILIE